jgi:hypothetical protein
VPHEFFNESPIFGTRLATHSTRKKRRTKSQTKDN